MWSGIVECRTVLLVKVTLTTIGESQCFTGTSPYLYMLVRDLEVWAMLTAYFVLLHHWSHLMHCINSELRLMKIQIPSVLFSCKTKHGS